MSVRGGLLPTCAGTQVEPVGGFRVKDDPHSLAQREFAQVPVQGNAMMLRPRQVGRQRDGRVGRRRHIAQVEPQPHLAKSEVVFGGGRHRQLRHCCHGRVARWLIDGDVGNGVGRRLDLIARGFGILDAVGILEHERISVRTASDSWNRPRNSWESADSAIVPAGLSFTRSEADASGLLERA